MSARSRVFSSLLAGALAVLGGGCRTDPTSLMVTVHFDEALHQPQRLDVTVAIGGSTLRMNTPVTAPGDRPVRDGDSFLVLVPDRYDGMVATVDVATIEANLPTLAAGRTATVRLHQVTPLVIPLDGQIVDGGAIDQRVSDDLTGVSDGAAVDSAGFDSAGIDIAGVTQFTCAAPLDVSSGGVFSNNSVGSPGSGTGSCGGATGVDVVARTTLVVWSMVTLDTIGSSYDTLLYTRLSCVDPASEPPIAGPCPGAETTSGLACSDDALTLGSASRLVLCGLPPGSYHTFLDGKGAGGPWTLNVAATPASLNTIAEAGNLLAGGTFPATTTGHLNNFTSTSSGCGMDSGATSADAVFFLTTTATHNLTFRANVPNKGIVYVRASPGGPDLACNAATKTPTVTLVNQPAGIYYVIVDGDTGPAIGDFTITATVN